MTITRYANVPFDELIRLAEDRHDPLITELIQRIEAEIGERLELELTDRVESSYEEGFKNGFAEGREDTLESLDGNLCLRCEKFVEDL